MERVLDTAALLHWPPNRLAGGLCATSQRQELERLSTARAMLIETADIQWRAPAPASLNNAKSAASASGDLARLSDVDLDVLALALAHQAVLVTDDYRLQNTYRHAGGTVEPVVNRPSKQVLPAGERSRRTCAGFLSDPIQGLQSAQTSASLPF